MKKALVVILGMLILIGCASNAGQIPAEINTTHTDEGYITETLLPSLTQTTTTLTKTDKGNTPTSTSTPSPTRDRLLRMISPNGDYIAVVYPPGHNGIDKQVLEITDYEGNLIRQIENNNGEVLVDISIYGWSADSKTLFYYYEQTPLDGEILFWWTGYDLRKINVENGYDQAVIPGEGAMSFALSRDETKIIYSLASEPAGVIHLLDFETEKNTKIYVDPAPEEFLRVGDFHWSPNGKAIIFQTEADWVGAYKEIGTVYLDVQTFTQKLLHRGGIYTYQFNGWEDDQTLRFYSHESGHILVDIETGEERPISTYISTSTSTITLRPTRTITPTSTIEPTKTLTPTITPPLPTYSTYPDTWQQGPWIREWSPDGKFLVEIYDYNGHGDIHGPVIEIFDQNNNMLWKIPYEGDTSSIYPYVSLHFLKWSLNGSELYYYTMFHGSGGDYVFKADGCDLSKIDLYTGEIQPLFPQGDGSAAFSMTNDGGRIVYSFFEENVDTVYIHNFWTGQTSSVVLDPAPQPYSAVGDFHWSPDGKGIVFQTEGEWLEFEGGGVYMEVQTIYLNTVSMEQKLIHRDAMYEYMLEDWIDNRTIRIHQRNETTHQHEVYAVDIFTGEETLLLEATPDWSR